MKKNMNEPKNTESRLAAILKPIYATGGAALLVGALISLWNNETNTALLFFTAGILSGAKADGKI